MFFIIFQYIIYVNFYIILYRFHTFKFASTVFSYFTEITLIALTCFRSLILWSIYSISTWALFCLLYTMSTSVTFVGGSIWVNVPDRLPT